MNIKGLAPKTCRMGGNKKKPTGSSDKGVSSGPAGDIKPAADEKKKSKPQQKQRLAVLIDENQGMKVIQGMKAVTVQSVARTAGVKISVANAYVKSLEAKGVVKSVGGYSGHRVYEFIKR
jgi:small subunit ribosomal protein S25e